MTTALWVSFSKTSGEWRVPDEKWKKRVRKMDKLGHQPANPALAFSIFRFPLSIFSFVLRASRRVSNIFGIPSLSNATGQEGRPKELPVCLICRFFAMVGICRSRPKYPA
jgi:hypothetical protein